MSNCDICEMIKKKESFKVVYEDELMVGMLHEAPAFLGHTILIPKQHFRIIEEVPDNVIASMMSVSNKISTALFESLNIHGTNILVNNGAEAGQAHAHFMINIIPRTENDKINMDWPPEKANPQKLESTYKFFKSYVEKAILGDTGEPKKLEENDKVVKSNADDYMIRQLYRQP